MDTQQQPPKLPSVFIWILTISAIIAPFLIVNSIKQTFETRQTIPEPNADTDSENDISVQDNAPSSPSQQGSNSGRENNTTVTNPSTVREESRQKADETVQTNVPVIERPSTQVIPEPEVRPEELTADNAYQEGRKAAQTSNHTKAVKFYQSAADRGIAAAAYDLALLYQKGQGVAKSEPLAFRYMKMAADAGYVNAFKPLGEMYHGGRGVGKDTNVAKNWYQKAVDAGDESARELIYRL